MTGKLSRFSAVSSDGLVSKGNSRWNFWRIIQIVPAARRIPGRFFPEFFRKARSFSERPVVFQRFFRGFSEKFGQKGSFGRVPGAAAASKVARIRRLAKATRKVTGSQQL